MHRRDFLRLAVAGTGLALIPRSSRAADAHIEVLLDEPIAPITPNLYGHFVEHLGGVVYDGIWVGEGSKVPNTGGIRRALVGRHAALAGWADPMARRMFRRQLRLARWRRAAIDPGRAARTSGPTTWRRCRTVRRSTSRTSSARTTSCGSAGWLVASHTWPPISAVCPHATSISGSSSATAPPGSSTLADLRATGGDRDPFSVRFWGVGNESWGCGGNFTPEEYATEYPTFHGVAAPLRRRSRADRFGTQQRRPRRGPAASSAKLTEKGEGTLRDVWGLALHHYSWNISRGATTDWNAGKGDAVQFTTDEWYELLNEADQMETLITDHWKVMDEIDRRQP